MTKDDDKAAADAAPAVPEQDSWDANDPPEGDQFSSPTDLRETPEAPPKAAEPPKAQDPPRDAKK